MSDRGRSPAPSSHRGSEGRPSQSSRGPGSPARSSAGGPAGNWPKPLGVDPAKPIKAPEKGNTRVELPPDAYLTDTKKDFFTLRGQKLNTEGKPETIEVNQYRMTRFNFNKKIYQYDVALSPDPEKLGPVMKKIWAHKATQEKLAPFKGKWWLHDGKKLAWAPALIERGELRFIVDLDEGQPGRSGGKRNKGGEFLVTIRHTTEVKVSALRGYLDHKMSFNNTVQEALNFLDHLVRQWPSQHMLAIKRNFYDLNGSSQPLNDGAVVQVHKGIYASVRMSHNISRGGVGLGYNIDVANTCFWTGGQFMDRLMCNFLATLDRRWEGQTAVQMYDHLKPMKDNRSGRLAMSDAFKQLRKLRRLKFKIRHPNRPNSDQIYSVQDFVWNDKYGEAGASARNVTFAVDGKETTIMDYYRKKYSVTLRNSNLPLIDAGKGGMIPLELAWVEDMQRYPFKLNPDQTAAMIKIAVTRPNVRKQDIQRNAGALQIGNDPFLKEYGVNFEAQFAKTEARILPAPVVRFGQGTADPKFAGRWDLRGKKFWKQNHAPLNNWGFIALEQGLQMPALQQFANTFKTTFIGHGGKVTGEPKIIQCPTNLRFNAAEAIAYAHQEIITKTKGYTQLLFVVISRKNSGTYERLKKSADCRFGILTQVVLAPHVMKNNGQYHSNVCMKVNAKLGGATACTPQLWKTATYFPDNRPTMIIGVDVSHAAPGGGTPSTAAMTMSIDKDGTRYAALVETNGYRVEILSATNVRFLFGNLLNQWKAGHPGKLPAHVMYLRDGVGEGQFSHVIDEEIGQIKAFLREKMPANAPLPKFTTIVATKRHHIRFFPQRGDKNGNPLPGTLVEKEVTHPFMWDFYLNSHVAIQGTARPVHYHVILDEMNMPVNDIQKMIYQQCYSYARSTTPVSLHPAVYYAHLASNRARAHENIATSEGFRSGPKGHEVARESVARGLSTGGLDRGSEAPPLLRLGGTADAQCGADEKRQRDFFRGTMWFI